MEDKKLTIIYRLSENGYVKIKPPYINNENCLQNALKIFPWTEYRWSIIADNISSETNDMIQKYITRDHIFYTNIGNGAGTFNIALDEALQLPKNEIVYFIENDYIHKPGSDEILKNGFDLGVDYMTLYLHPDKFLPPQLGGNPHVDGDGGYITKIFQGKKCLFGMFDSTTMTFASKVQTLIEDENILREYTKGTHPEDFQMFMKLKEKNRSLLCPLESYSTHGETKYLAPFEDWEKLV